MRKKNESGRTMVEMLAVLVIFIVLSLLGIVGFDFMKNRQKANEVMKVAINIFNISRTKGINTTTEYERMEVPKGVGRMDVKIADKIVIIYHDPYEITNGVVNAIKTTYPYQITQVTETDVGKDMTYHILQIQF